MRLSERLRKLLVASKWTKFWDIQRKRIRGVETGILKLDQTLLGLGDLTVIQGAPKCNKSTLALQIAVHNAKKGLPVIYIDRENGDARVQARLLCQLNRCTEVDVRTADPQKQSSLMDSVAATPNFFIAGSTVKDPKQIQDLLVEVFESFDRCVLVVDSIQKMPPLGDDKKTSTYKWMEALDQFKLYFAGKLTTLVVSEKKRGTYKEAALDGAKESGSVEYTAEMVLDVRLAANGSLICEVVANRDGAQGFAVGLEKVMAVKDDPHSFCYLLQSIDQGNFWEEE